MARASWFMTVFALVLVAVSADEKASLRKARRNVLHVESSFVESLWGQEANDAAEMEKVNAEAVDSNERELFDRQLQSSRMLFQF